MRELETRSGIARERIHSFVAAGVLSCGEDSTFRMEDISLVRLLDALVAAGVSVEALQASISSGHLSFAFAELVFGREGTDFVDETFEERCRTLAVDTHAMAEAFEAAGLPRPHPGARLRQADAEAMQELATMLRLGSEALLVRWLRLVGAGMTRITEAEAHLYHAGFEEPLLQSGMNEQSMRDAASQMSPVLRRLTQHILVWLYARHQDHATLEHVIEHVEEAMEGGSFGYRRERTDPAVGFLDLTGYTSFTEQRGDEAAARAAEMLSALVTSVSARSGGRPIKWLGDGVMLYFANAAEGVRFGLDAVAQVPRSGLLPAHFGLSAGPVIFKDGDYFGRTVNLAARVAGHATAGEVLVTQDAARECALADVSFEPLGEVTLKGVSAPVALHRAVRHR